MARILVDVSDGTEYTEYYDDRACCNISHMGDIVEIRGNRECLELLVRQMVYFASNNHCLPFGSHIHYCSFNHVGFRGTELILEVVRDLNQEIVLDKSELLQVELLVPCQRDEIRKCWKQGSRVSLEKIGANTVYLLGNAKGLHFLATAALYLLECGQVGDSFLVDQQLLTGWEGMGIRFTFA